MSSFKSIVLISAIIYVGSPSAVVSEILALTVVQSQVPETVKAFKLTGSRDPKESLFILDVDPNSKTFGKTLMTIPLPSDFLANEVFFNPDKSKGYVTSRGKSEMFVFGLNRYPYRLRKLELPDCKTGQNLIFSQEQKLWYLTCRMSAKVIVGDSATDTIRNAFEVPNSYPHDLVIFPKLGELLISSSVSGDLNDKSDFLIRIDLDSGEEISRQLVSKNDSSVQSAPTELLKIPGSNPPAAFVVSMFAPKLRVATWDASVLEFKIETVFDFTPLKSSFLMELTNNSSQGRLYVTEAKPGRLHVLKISQKPLSLKLIKTIKLAEGARQAALSRDGKYIFIQNSYLNLPGMSDGTITVVEQKSLKVVGSMNILKDQGLNPNSIILLPN